MKRTKPAGCGRKLGRFDCCTVIAGDALELLGELPPGTFDAVITDPPYSSGGQFFGARTQGVNAKYIQSDSGNQKLEEFAGDNKDQRSFTLWSTLWSALALRACKPGAVAAFFTDWRQLPVSTDYLQAAGWTWRGIVPWLKPSARPQMGRFRAACEYLVWGSKGALPIERGVGCVPGFFRCVPPQNRIHPTQKPLQLMRDILAIVPAGGLVLDPFTGSGTTAEACAANGLHFLAFELSPTFASYAGARVKVRAT